MCALKPKKEETETPPEPPVEPKPDPPEEKPPEEKPPEEKPPPKEQPPQPHPMEERLSKAEARIAALLKEREALKAGVKRNPLLKRLSDILDTKIL